MTGTITRLVQDRRYGFIRGVDNREYFFHGSALPAGQFEELVENDEVEIESSIMGPKGLRADSVRRTNPAPTEAA